jgi:hypothetical protein
VTILEADLAAKYQTFVLSSKLPMWMGEFGAFMKDHSAEQWLEDAKTLFDKYQVGWAWWAYTDPGHGNSIPDCLKNPSTSVTQVLLFIPTVISHPKNWFQSRPFNRWIL